MRVKEDKCSQNGVWRKFATRRLAVHDDPFVHSRVSRARARAP